jgi:hypothetical protein
LARCEIVQLPAPFELPHTAAPLASHPPAALLPPLPPVHDMVFPFFVQLPADPPVVTVTVPLLHFTLEVAASAAVKASKAADTLTQTKTDRRMLVSLAESPPDRGYTARISQVCNCCL